MLLTIMGNADEGMWLFNAPPRKLLQEKFKFDPRQTWLDHVQKSAVRFNNGGSGSFVSEEGLIISNHHVGADALQKVSDEKHNYLRDGFYARTRGEEKKCLDLELNVLMTIEDVTERVNAVVKQGMSAEDAFGARRAVMAEIEKESLDKTGLRSDVVTLYQGGRYHLYRYKRYTDVRLVFAPEQQIAFFGGDPDNFEYPRYNLDICLFRAYENEKPAKVEDYLKWSTKGVSENELIFVAGHPGRTDRQLLVSELEYLRDESYSYLLARLNRLEVMLNAYSSESLESARRAKGSLFGVQNSRKARQGMQAGLLDPQLMGQKAADEKKLYEAIKAEGSMQGTLTAWEEIRKAQEVIGQNHLEYSLLEGAHGFGSTYFQIARTIVRAVEEKSKPSGERLREYRDSNRQSLELGLFSEEPIYDDFEEVKLTHSLVWLTEQLGYTNKLVQQVLAGQVAQSPGD